MDVSKDYYKILEISKNATKKEIRSAYLRLAKTWHPDLHKLEKDKETARLKFIEMQEAYEVMYHDGMRKKYDEMRRYGVSQDQYKAQEAYQKYQSQQQQQPFSRTPRGPSAYGNAWEQDFRQNMQREWEKVRREQQDWASQRRRERHEHSDDFPFGGAFQRARGDFRPNFGGAFGGPGSPGAAGQPMDHFFRIMLYTFLVFLSFRLIGLILFGDRHRHRHPPFPDHGPRDPRSPWFRGPPSPYDPDERRYIDRHNPNFPPPFSLKDKGAAAQPHKRKNEELHRDHEREQRQTRFVPPPPPSKSSQSQSQPQPRSRNSHDSRNDNNTKEDTFDMDEGNRLTFSKPSEQQSTDVSSPGDQTHKFVKARSKYERMQEEQRMVEEVYIRARKQEMQNMEDERERSVQKRFGKRNMNTPPAPTGATPENEDVNEAWNRYLNSKRGNESNWRDRGRPSR